MGSWGSSPKQPAPTPAMKMPDLSKLSAETFLMRRGTVGATKNTVRWYRPSITPINDSGTPYPLAVLTEVRG